jgi:cytochrome c oxidase subunit II
MLDKYEIRVLTITAVVVMIFIFCILYVAGKRISDVPECIPFNASYAEPHINKIDDSTYQVFVVAQMWSFQPSEIYIPVGSTVDFYVTSKDVVHGFFIDEKNVNMMAEYGNVTKSTVKFTQPGIYKIDCHEYCGVGHQNMQAEVIVNYPRRVNP